MKFSLLIFFLYYYCFIYRFLIPKCNSGSYWWLCFYLVSFDFILLVFFSKGKFTCEVRNCLAPDFDDLSELEAHYDNHHGKEVLVAKIERRKQKMESGTSWHFLDEFRKRKDKKATGLPYRVDYTEAEQLKMLVDNSLLYSITGDGGSRLSCRLWELVLTFRWFPCLLKVHRQQHLCWSMALVKSKCMPCIWLRKTAMRLAALLSHFADFADSSADVLELSREVVDI